MESVEKGHALQTEQIRTELSLKFEFEASHSLAGYEAPHPHMWTLETSFTGTPIGGKLIDMMLLRSGIAQILEPLIRTYLNENPFVSDDVRAFPTCETLSQFFLEKIRSLIYDKFLNLNPSLKVSSVAISIHSMDKEEIGRVRRIES